MKEAGSEEEMIALGEGVGGTLAPGDVLGLVGDLGAGKTHFVKGIAKGLGSSEEVTSPTFTLVHEYRAGQIPVHHFDLYRLGSAEELLAIGWDEYLDDRGGIVVAEWAEKFPELFPAETRWWFFEVLEGGRRRVWEGNRP